MDHTHGQSLVVHKNIICYYLWLISCNQKAEGFLFAYPSGWGRQCWPGHVRSARSLAQSRKQGSDGPRKGP